MSSKKGLKSASKTSCGGKSDGPVAMSKMSEIKATAKKLMMITKRLNSRFLCVLSAL